MPTKKRESALEQEPQPKKVNTELPAPPVNTDDQELEFEDRYDSEFDDSDEIIVQGDEDDDETTKFDQENDELCQKVEDLQVYLPGQEIAEDEELVADQSAYDMLHSMGVEWPCLSFDIFSDKLGNDRREYPMTSYICAGSQAANYNENKIYLMKISKLSKTKIDEDESDEDDDFDEDPILEYKTLDQVGGTNRIRVMAINHRQPLLVVRIILLARQRLVRSISTMLVYNLSLLIHPDWYRLETLHLFLLFPSTTL